MKTQMTEDVYETLKSSLFCALNEDYISNKEYEDALEYLISNGPCEDDQQ